MMMIQWFPGHMAKTRRLIAENLKLVDVVIEMVDARLPFSSRNPLIDELIGAKPRLVIMAKADLAEEELTKAWINHFAKDGWPALACNFHSDQPKQLKNAILKGIKAQGAGVLERRQSRGIKDMTIRVMVTGIPNVGKSTLINLFAGKAQAETGDRPGVTRGKQWIRLSKDLELLDMPGILWPKIEDENAGRKLAVTGAIGENAYDPEELCLWLINWLRENRPGRLQERYKVAEDVVLEKDETAATDESAESLKQREAHLILEEIGKKRGFLRKGGVVETLQTAVLVLDEVRAGKLGPITWDDPAIIESKKDESGENC